MTTAPQTTDASMLSALRPAESDAGSLVAQHNFAYGSPERSALQVTRWDRPTAVVDDVFSDVVSYGRTGDPSPKSRHDSASLADAADLEAQFNALMQTRRSPSALPDIEVEEDDGYFHVNSSFFDDNVVPTAEVESRAYAPSMIDEAGAFDTTNSPHTPRTPFEPTNSTTRSTIRDSLSPEAGDFSSFVAHTVLIDGRFKRWIYVLLAVLLAFFALRIGRFNPAGTDDADSRDSLLSGFPGRAVEPLSVAVSDLEGFAGTADRRLAKMDSLHESHSNRLGDLERDVRSINARLQLHETSINRLEDILPRQIVLGLTAEGQPEIDPAFWTALKAKLEEAEKEEGYGEIDREARWNDWIKINEQNINMLIREAVAEERQPLLDGIVKQHRLISRDEFMALMQEKFVLLHQELEEHKARTYVQIAEEIAARYYAAPRERVLQNSAPEQLLHFVESVILTNMAKAMSSVNWLSPALGAAIDPHGTSSTWQGRRKPAKGRLQAWLKGGVFQGYPPQAVLDPWLDLEHCWCTSSQGTDARITILPATVVFPTELTVEFAPAGAVPDFTMAPRRMQLWGRVIDQSAYGRLSSVAQGIFDWEQSKTPYNPRGGWVPLSEIEYDPRRANYVQNFPLALDMEGYGARVDAISLRFMDNWGDKERTCVYRLRLHGKEAPGRAGVWPEDAPAQRPWQRLW